MSILFILLFLYLLLNININFNGLNKDYLNKNNTLIVNALFVILVYYRHFSQYISIPTFIIDKIFFIILDKSEQLIVITFLFFSGYGIYECIKNKKDYIKNFGKKRFLKTYLNYAFAVLLFVLLNLFMNNDLSIVKVLLSFTSYESIGNSNWYMLAIFAMYTFILIAFNITKNHKKSLIIMTILSIIYSIFDTKCIMFYRECIYLYR